MDSIISSQSYKYVHIYQCIIHIKSKPLMIPHGGARWYLAKNTIRIAFDAEIAFSIAASLVRSFCRELNWYFWNNLSRNARKRTFWYVSTTKTQISLRAREVWSEYSSSEWRSFASLVIQNAPREDSDQTARMRSLIWIFTGHKCPKVRFLMFWLNLISDS